MFLYQEEKEVKQKKVLQPRPAEQRVRQALDHVEQGACPIIPAKLASIRERLNEKYYENSRQNLILDVLSDPGLFAYLVRNLKHKLVDAGKIDFADALLHLESDKLLDLFDIQPADASTHLYSKASRQQKAQLDINITANAVASELARRSEIDCVEASMASMCRQLGLTLIAWNYPSIHSRAMLRHRREHIDLDQELNRILGISPIQLGHNYLKKHRIAFEENKVFAQVHSPTSPGANDLAEVAEVYARAQEPTLFPEASKKLEIIKPALEEHFGQSILAELDEVKKALELTPAEPAEKAAQEKRGQRDHAQVHVAASLPKSLKHCKPEVVQAFEAVFQKIKAGQVSIEALKMLIENVAPKLGFECGCLFLPTKDDQHMYPALRLGPLPLSCYHEYMLDKHAGMKPYIFDTIPMRREGLGLRGEIISYLCSGLNDGYRSGVLYVELSKSASNDLNLPALSHFQAFREALVACLDDRKK